MNDHRLPDRLIGYWETLKKESDFPDFSHFNASAIADIWQHCVLFTVSPTVEGKAPVLNFHQVGDKVRDVYGKDMVGRSFNTGQRHFQGAAIVRRMEETITTPAPLIDTGQFVNDNSKVIKFRSCLLPFGSDGKITHVVVGFSWREY